MKISDLKTLEHNPRAITQEALGKLAESIKRNSKFMPLRPIVIDDADNVLGGNQRLRAIRDILGMDEVPDSWVVRASDLSEQERREFVLVDNVQSGDWDIDLLREHWMDVDLEGLGILDVNDVAPLDDMPALPDGDREPFQQMTFTLHDEQVEQVKAAIDVAKGMGAFDSPNENSNGNALARVCETFLTSHAHS